MPGAIRESVKRVFKSVANDPQYRDWTVEEQHARACEIAVATGATAEDQIPSVDWAYKFLRPFRNYEHWLDDSWSMATLNRPDFDISPAALPHVLSLWGRCLVGGRRLTNREVLWVSRLYAVAPSSLRPEHQYSELLSTASRYAREHRAADVLGKTLDTTWIDALVAFRRLQDDPQVATYGDAICQLLDDMDDINWMPLALQVKEEFISSARAQAEYGLNTEETQRLVDFLDSLDPSLKTRDLPMHTRQLLIMGMRRLARDDPNWRNPMGDENCEIELRHLIAVLRQEAPDESRAGRFNHYEVVGHNFRNLVGEGRFLPESKAKSNEEGARP